MNFIVSVAKALTNLNQQQKNLLYTALFGTTGPVAYFLSKKLGLADAEVNMWLQFLAGLTSLISIIVLPALATNKAQVNAIATMPEEEKAAAFAQAKPEVKTAAAASVQGVTVVADQTAPAEVVALAQDPNQPNIVSTGDHQ